MKKFIAFLVVIFTAFLIACSGPKETKKVSGIVKKFNPAAGSSSFARRSVSVQFTDGRYFVLSSMPEVQIEPGSEIVIYYTSKNDYQIFNDSIRIIKAAPGK